jgi:CheY-like chemotaxis protein
MSLRSAPGRGSVFAFALPAAPPGVPLAPTPVAGAEAAQVALPLRPGLVVLVVEDNAVVADGIAALLRLWGARPQLCGSAAEALALPDLAAFDIALCDIRLPGRLDGIALATELQRRRPSLPIALVSADIDDATQQLAHERGWQALRKPVQPATLQALLRRLQR